jgi:hypothetical protein
VLSCQLWRTRCFCESVNHTLFWKNSGLTNWRARQAGRFNLYTMTSNHSTNYIHRQRKNWPVIIVMAVTLNASRAAENLFGSVDLSDWLPMNKQPTDYRGHVHPMNDCMSGNRALQTTVPVEALRRKQHITRPPGTELGVPARPMAPYAAKFSERAPKIHVHWFLKFVNIACAAPSK